MPAIDRYAVTGHPVDHSRSPAIHALFAEQTGQSLIYDRLPAPLDGFRQTVDRFFSAGGAGLNVTLPFKQEAAAYAGQLTDRAERAAAVNTLMATATGVLGDNTDGTGLVADLSGRLAISLKDAHVVILGAGGAVRGVVPSLLAAGAACITLANRTPDRAAVIASACQDMGDVRACGLDDAPHDAALVINAISAGLSGRMPTLDARILDRATAVYDMIYSEEPTPFLRWAADHGVCGQDGLGMLVEQAAESFALWRGVRPATDPVMHALRGRP